MLDRAANPGRHALKERKDDLYETPAVAVEALLKVESFPRIVWEPACGPGAIVRVLRDHDYLVHATDLVDYGCEFAAARVDFLLEIQAPQGVGAIITNPPFKLATEFVERALLLVPKVAMLLRLGFIESVRRSPILDDGQLARVYPFANRLPMMHRDGWDGPKASSATPFCWFVWDRHHRGPTQLRRLTWGNA